jgi:hypothetical protein
VSELRSESYVGELRMSEVGRSEAYVEWRGSVTSEAT